MNRTGVGSTPRSKSGPQDPEDPLWLRALQALACPAAQWAGLGMLTLIAVLCLATCLAPVALVNVSTGQVSWLVGWGGTPRMTCDWYFRHGQWRADISTTLQVVRFVLSPGGAGAPMIHRRAYR
jgi:hypothetical protein